MLSIWKAKAVATVNAKDGCGKALQVATQGLGSKEVIETLLTHGAAAINFTWYDFKGIGRKGLILMQTDVNSICSCIEKRNTIHIYSFG